MGRVISDAFVQNAWALGDRWRNQRKEGKIRNAMAGWDTDPETVIRDVMQIDRNEGVGLMKLHAIQQEKAAEVQENKRKMKLDTLQRIGTFLDAADDTPDATPEAVFDQIRPILSHTMELPDDEVDFYRNAYIQNPSFVKALVKKATGEKPTILGPGSQMRDPTTGALIAEAPFAPRAATAIQVDNDKGGKDVYVFDPGTGTFRAPGTTMPSSTGGAGLNNGTGPLSPDEAWDFIAKQEGGYAANDGNGHPANFGFNQKWNPDINVRELTPETARQRYKSTRFPSEIANMPRGLALAYADMYFRNPGKAKSFLNASNGDVNKFMELREAWDAKQPAAETYAQRNQNLRAAIGGGGSSIGPSISTAGPPKNLDKDRARQLTPAEVQQRDLDPSYRWQEMPNGETKIIGPARPAKTANQQNQAARLDAASANLDELMSTAKQLRTHKGLPRITGIMGYIPNMPGGDAADADAILEKLKSQISLNVLQTMRDLSKTGGALGNVSNYEIKTLENNLAALNKAQSLEQYQSELARLEKRVEGIKKRLYAAAQQDGAIDKPSGGGSSGGIPQGAINMLKSNPSGQMRLFFDQKYGKGAAARVLGR